MEYISVKQASQKWGISERRIRILCSEGRVDGVTRSSWAWNIPSSAPKPADGRTLRHIKNFDLRTGGLDLRDLEEFHSELKNIHLSQDIMLHRTQINFHRFLYIAFAEEGIPIDVIDTVLSGKIPEGTSLEQILLIKNAFAILADFHHQTGLGSFQGNGEIRVPYFSEQRINATYALLHRGIDDFLFPAYRNISIPVAGTWSGDERSFSVDVQMKTLLVQYEKEWSYLNPLVRATFMFGELLRITPFSSHTYLFAFLIFAGNLLSGGYPLPSVAPDRIDELKADLVMTLKRGHYNKILKMFEDGLFNEFPLLLRNPNEH